MTPFKLVRRNITRQFKRYFLYFITILLSAAIFYTFMSLRAASNSIQEGLVSNQNMSTLFTGASVLLILFVLIFIRYSNAFFVRHRKKEIALYSLMGMKKSTIGKMLLYENLIIGTFALLAGIGLGIGCSYGFTRLLLYMLGSSASIIPGVSSSSLWSTFLVFAAILLLISFQSYRIIYRFPLISLFRAEKEGDTVPKTAILPACAAVVLIIVGYILAFQRMATDEELLIQLLLVLATVISGTWLFFRSVTVYLIRASQRRKPTYYRGMNLVSISNMLFRVTGHSRTFTVVALLSALTLAAMTITYGTYVHSKDVAHRDAPFSYIHLSQGEALDQQVDQLITSDMDHPVIARLDIPFIQLNGNLSELSLRDYYSDADPVNMIAQRTYEQMAEALDIDPVLQLQEDEGAAVKFAQLSLADMEGQLLQLRWLGGSQSIELTEFVEKRFVPWFYYGFYILVSDSLFDSIATQMKPSMYKAYKVSEQATASETSGLLTELLPREAQLSTFYGKYMQAVEGSGIITFIMAFLGLVFLAATGSILYFKQLSEAYADKERYAILRNIGVQRHEILSSIAKQTLFIFMLPLGIGVLHGGMLLQLLRNDPEFAGINFTMPILMASVAFGTIYLVYYVGCVISTNYMVNRLQA